MRGNLRDVVKVCVWTGRERDGAQRLAFKVGSV